MALRASVWFVALSASFVHRLSASTSNVTLGNVTALDQIMAKTGRFLVYTLRSESFFDKPVPTDFIASLEGRPDLPLWLHLAQSPRSSEAFLYGTPESDNVSETILVDWCQFRLSTISRTNAEQTALLFDKQEVRPLVIVDSDGVTATPSVPKIMMGTFFMHNERNDDAFYFGKRRHYFWDWVMVVAVPAAILLVLLLFLSALFCGCREGQHWRDYKTPQGQLSEYVNLRRTQVRLRMLSNQRQSLDFLDGGGEQLRTTTPVGKQTVADAAACRGSSLQLYENGTGYHHLDAFENGKPKETMLISRGSK